MKLLYLGAALTALGLTAAARIAAQLPPAVDTARILAADKEPGNWLTHGRTYTEQRFSLLTQVNADTVGRLGLAWSYEFKVPRGASATPLVADGVMYVTSAWSIVYALDARTGRELWVYDPAVDRGVGADTCCDVINRGVALYDGKVFVGVIDGRLVALDARTGKVAWETLTADRRNPYTITGAPRAVNGLVYIGNGGAEFGVRGYVSAYHTNTGKLAWRFYTVPGDPAKGPDGAASDPVMAKAAATWTGEWWKIGGGGTAWDAIVYDAEFDQVLVGVGNGSPWNQQLRSPGGGDNLFLASILALDAKTGAYKWHYQTTPGETWDYTATQPIVLADLTIDSAVRKVAMQAPKNGFFYVIDRANGRLISAKPLLPMFTAQDTPEGMPLSWASAVNLTTGRPVENPNARYLGAVALVRPGPFGTHNWHPMAFSPETGLVYIPVQDMAFGYEGTPTLAATPVTKNIGLRFQPFPTDRTVRAAIKGASKGFLIAWDPVRQQEAWRVEHNGPWNGGTLATAAGLVFEGTIDGRFLALDAKTGRQAWSFDTGLATLAGPVSYAVRGEQYVAVLSGDGSAFMLIGGVLGPRAATSANGRVYAFKIGGRAVNRPVPVEKVVFPKPPAIAASAEDVRRGGMFYDQFCMTCHGLAAIGGVNPDLRRSAMLFDAVAWRAFVGGEGMPSRAMPRFSKHLTADDAERIRAYVASELADAADRPTTSAGRQP